MGCGISRLPAEIFLEIAHYLYPGNLVVLIRTSKLLNDLIAPILYRSIILEDTGEVISACCKTLSSPHNDLASMVHTFHILACTRVHSQSLPLEIRQHLPGALRRMPNLESFVCVPSILVLPSTLVALCTCTTLRSFAVTLRGANGVNPSDQDIPENFRPYLPLLTTISIKANRDSTFNVQDHDFLQAIIHSHSHQLKHISLTLRGWGGAYSSLKLYSGLLRTPEGFPELESLAIPSGVLGALTRASTLKVHTLTVTSTDGPLTFIPEDSFPNLTELACPSEVLEYFTREKEVRPVNRLCLDGTYFMQPTLHIYHSTRYSSNIYTLRVAIQSLEKLGWPVLDLGFELSGYNLLTWLTEVASALSGIERLTIHLHASPDLPDVELPTLGREIFSNLPRLRTAVLCDKDGRVTFSHVVRIRDQVSGFHITRARSIGERESF